MNNLPQTVRKPAVPCPGARVDRRVLRTRVALGNALVDLMIAGNFDDIRVQQVLDRAKVGRATFYSHFRNKNDLLLSDAERFCEMLLSRFLASAGSGRRVAPVAELFSHVADFHAFQRALDRSGLREPVADLIAGYLARTIEQRILELRPEASNASLPTAVMSRMFAAALLEMMRWWLDHGAQPEPQEMDRRYHEIVWSGLSRVVP